MKKIRIISALTAAAVLASVTPPVVGAASPIADIRINEVCSQNKACLTDSYGESADWVELYNASDEDVPLTGYSISKDPQKPKSWTFPDGAVIKAGGYLVLIASKNVSVGGEYHVGFNLSKNGETLTLKAPDGSTVHELVVPTLGEDVTYGITYNGNAEIMEPTPGKLNAVTVSAPNFSEPSGFYENETELSLSASGSDTIYYTIDGSNPVTSPTAVQYTGAFTVKDRSAEANIYRAYGEKEGDPLSICAGMNYKPPTIPVDKATVVRAVAKNPDGIYSEVVQQTYFITDGVLADYADATVISLVTDPANLFDPDKGIYVVGNKWKWNTPPWGIDEGSNIRNYHGRGKEWEREANMTVFDSGENIVEQNVGIRIRGSSTRNSVSKSLNIFARSEYGASKISYPLFPDNLDSEGNLIEEYDSISLRSAGGTNVKDAICQAILKDRENATVVAKRPCVLFINGEYWGIYDISEKLSDEFISQHYGVKKSNVAMIKNGNLEEGDSSDLYDFQNLVHKYADLDLSKEANYKEACKYFDIDSIIEEYASGIYFGKWDWPDYNYGAWKDKTEGADNRWHFMSYDFDNTLGSTYEDVNQPLYSYNFFDRVGGGFPSCLFRSLIKNYDFRMKFAKVFKEEYADKKDEFLKIAEEIGESRYKEMVKTKYFIWTGNSSNGLQTAENDIRKVVLDVTYEYIKKHPTYARAQLYKYLDISPVDIDEYEGTATTVTTAATTQKTTTTSTTTTTTKTPDETKYETADLVKISKFILDSGNLDDWERYDICKDGRIDVFDMCLLRKKIAENMENLPNLVDPEYITWHASDGADAAISKTSGVGFVAEVLESGPDSWSVQIKCKKIKIEKGSQYRVSFDYVADVEIPLYVSVGMSGGDYSVYHGMEFTTGRNVQHFSEIFTMEDETDSSARLAFNLGAVENAPYSLTVNNIRVEKIS